MTETVHVAAYDTLADWEIGYATAHINKPLWHKNPGRFATATVRIEQAPITTMGGTWSCPMSCSPTCDRGQRHADPRGQRHLE